MAELDSKFELISRKEAKASGQTHYFTSKPCPNNHVSPRFVTSCGCVECTLEGTTNRRRKNPEHARSLNLNFKRKHRVKINADYRSRYAANPEPYRARGRKKYWADPEKAKAYAKRYFKKVYYGSVRDAARSRTRQWAAENPERAKRNVAVSRHKRRALERGADGKFTAQDIAGLYAVQVGCCVYCNSRLEQKYHVDHIRALARGGTNDPSNLQLLCRPCNLAKGARDPIVHAQSLGLLL